LPEGEDLRIRFRSPDFKLEEADWKAASWSLRNAKKSGLGIPDGRVGRICFLPLQTWRGVLGVLGVRAALPTDSLSREQWELMEGFVSQAASAIERALLAEEARQAQILQEGNKLQKALLNSISHNLRTPLASITGAISSLLEDQAVRDTNTERELLETALGESERLNRVVANLLDMTRLETGGVGVKLEPVDVQEVLGTAFEHLGGATRGREIRVHIEPNLPLVDMDHVLIAQVFVNLIDNALKYSDPEQPVDVRAKAEGDNLEVEVEDRGIGIAPTDLEHVFERFYRAPRTRVNGMGLGLSICRRFVEAHGGTIRVSSAEQAGTKMTFQLPLAAGVSVEVANGRTGTSRLGS
jgi:two-component system sensor histidine kinase KdpD